MDTKKTGDYMLRNEMWMIPVRPSRWRNVLDAAGKSRRQHDNRLNILDRAKLLRSRK